MSDIKNWTDKIARIIRKNCSNLKNWVGMVTHLNIPRPEFDVSKKRNILIMIDTISRGGAERVASQLASGLSDSCNVVLLYNKERENQYQIDTRVQVIRMPVFYYDADLSVSSKYVRELKKAFHIDVSISLLHRMNCRNVYSKGKDVVVVSERNNPLLAYPENYELSREIYDRADQVVFQTEEVRSMFSEKTRSHSVILPNPVSVSCFADPARGKRIVNAARLHENKNQEMLIRAFATFCKCHGEYTLSFYGEGPIEDELKSLSEELGIKDKVKFHGNVKNIHEQIADAGIFALSSNVEGMPNALLEAMMMGLPCISTNCTGAKEVIRNMQNGILVDMKDENAMAMAMAYMADHPDEAEKMRRQAMDSVEQFRKDKAIAKWKEFVESL